MTSARLRWRSSRLWLCRWRTDAPGTNGCWRRCTKTPSLDGTRLSSLPCRRIHTLSRDPPWRCSTTVILVASPLDHRQPAAGLAARERGIDALEIGLVQLQRSRCGIVFHMADSGGLRNHEGLPMPKKKRQRHLTRRRSMRGRDGMQHFSLGPAACEYARGLAERSVGDDGSAVLLAPR